MKKVAELKIPQMFAFYARREQGVEDLICGDCWQRFSMPTWQYHSSHIHCPRCGKNKARSNIGDYTVINAPTSMSLRVISGKTKVFLRVEFSAYTNDKNGEKFIDQCFEEFCFDSETRRTTWRKRIPAKGHYGDSRAGKRLKGFYVMTDPIDITNPFNVSFLSMKECPSILYNFNYESYPISTMKTRSKVTAFIKSLRNEIERLIFERDGIRPKGLYTPTINADSGSFLIPLKVWAMKLAFPDAEIKNILEYYTVDKVQRCGSGKNSFSTEHFTRNITVKMFDQAIELSKQGYDHITCLLKGFRLPNKKMLRRQVKTYGIFHASRILQASKFVKNYDFLVKISDNTEWEFNELGRKFFTSFLVKKYTEAEIARWFTEEVAEASDTIDMFLQLSPEKKDELFQEKISISELHERLVLEKRGGYAPNYSLQIPDHIRRRLEMQMDRIKFFLPHESIELEKAGMKLKNCLRIYSPRVLKGESMIIFAADEKSGKLLAAIRLENNNIKEAKVFGNKPVHQNLEVNHKIITWAKTVGIKLDTKDVEVPKKEKTNVVELRRAAG